MSKLVRKRMRLVRVRHVQHMLAVAETAQARDAAAAIENNVQRLASMRGELFGQSGGTFGGMLGAQRELAGRLETAGRQLDGALYDANRKIEQKLLAAQAADRDREIAERLKDKARRAADEKLEARIAAIPQHRRINREGDGEA